MSFRRKVNWTALVAAICMFVALPAQAIASPTAHAPSRDCIVYVTKSGARFHRVGCGVLRRGHNVRRLWQRDALAAGYTPCSVCGGSDCESALQRTAERHVKAVLERYRYVGVLAMEFFVENGKLVANEMAPRVHNSGHWTIEGAETSQFENHLRAIAGLPLGSTAARGHAAMVNFVGRMPALAGALAIPGLHLHDYGKREARPGRKLGHGTVVATTARARDLLLARLRRLA